MAGVLTRRGIGLGVSFERLVTFQVSSHPYVMSLRVVEGGGLLADGSNLVQSKHLGIRRDQGSL
jgi:hypothetical protein